jgi:tyrosyl-tRNA synthetase
MRKMKNKEKFVLTTKLLTDPTGKKMGKSEGNMINLDDNPQDMFGKIMSWPDELIDLGFELCTRVELENVEKGNPRDQKAALAKEIVKMYHGPTAAEGAEEEFNKVHRDKELPTDLPIFETDRKQYPMLDLLCDTKLAPSKNEAKRLVEGGGVVGIINDKEEKITDWKNPIELKDNMIIRKGNRSFVKIKLK